MTIQNSKAKMLVVLSSLLIAGALFVSCNNAVEDTKAAEPPATETTTPATTESTPKDTADTKPVGDPPKKVAQ